MTVELQKKFVEYLRANSGLSDNSIYNYKLKLGQIIKKCGKEADIEALNGFLHDHPRTIYRATIVWYLQYRGQPTDKVIKIKPKHVRPKDILTLNEVELIVNSLEREEKLMAKFMLNTMCRCHEMLKLKGKDVNPKQGTVIFETKGGKYRKYPLSGRFRDELLEYVIEKKGILPNDYIFWNETKLGFPSQASTRTKVVEYWKVLNQNSTKLIGKKIGTHDFRRFSSVLIYRNTKDLRLVQRLLGHGSIATTERYISQAVGEDDIARASETIEKTIGQLS